MSNQAQALKHDDIKPIGVMCKIMDVPCPNGSEVVLYLSDNSTRFLTNEEWVQHYEKNPFSIEEAHPDRLRRLFKDKDGELFGLLAERFRASQANDHRKVTRLTNLVMFKTLPTTEVGRLLKADLVKRHKESRATKEPFKANDDVIAMSVEPVMEGA